MQARYMNEEKKREDWLLNPVNLYMKGMAQRKKVVPFQDKIILEQRQEILKRLASKR